MAIVSFVIGSFLFGLADRIGSRCRGLLFTSFAVQAICLATAAALVQAKSVPKNADSFKVLIPIVLLGLQAGGQVCASNLLGFRELPTTVLTSVYSGLVTDPKVTAGLRENPKRNRRVAAIALLLLGAVAGGWLTRSGEGLSAILWIAAGLKFIIAACWLFWKKER
jgi:uncharacterized membrane protein YoaK (UPF0700 family)